MDGQPPTSISSSLPHLKLCRRWASVAAAAKAPPAPALAVASGPSCAVPALATGLSKPATSSALADVASLVFVVPPVLAAALVEVVALPDVVLPTPRNASTHGTPPSLLRQLTPHQPPQSSRLGRCSPIHGLLVSHPHSSALRPRRPRPRQHRFPPALVLASNGHRGLSWLLGTLNVKLQDVVREQGDRTPGLGCPRGPNPQ
jgi:hypothetical protein